MFSNYISKYLNYNYLNAYLDLLPLDNRQQIGQDRLLSKSSIMQSESHYHILYYYFYILVNFIR